MLNFIGKYLSQIESSVNLKKPFAWLYAVIAILNLLNPLLVLYTAVVGNVFSAPAKWVVFFVIMWIVMAFVALVSFMLWWDRKDKVSLYAKNDKDEFVITPVVSHFVQTFGEWVGTWVGVFGFAMSLFGLIFGMSGARMDGPIVGLISAGGILGLILFPISGFLIIVASRFLAEQFRALTAVANNTRK